MKYKAAFPSQYLQGKQLLQELPDLMKSFGSNGLLFGSSSIKEKLLPRFAPELPGQFRFELFNRECSQTEVKRLYDFIRQNNIDILAGIGGGKAIDTAKIAADLAGIPVIVVPTIASTDAPCSGCAVTYTTDGVFESVLYQKRNPAAVVVDMDVIAAAPTRFLIAGMGDALATWFEARSCHQTKSVNECGGLCTLTGLHLARLCYDTLLQYGVAAKTANEEHEVTPALNYVTEANILLSGIGFESGGLAAAHSVHNGLTAIPETHNYYHGEKVAFGVLTGLFLTDASQQEIEEVYAFCELIGLPTTLEQIGLDQTDPCDLLKAAEKVCAPGQPIHHEAGKITPEKVLGAMNLADAMGRERKQSDHKPEGIYS